MNFYDYLFYRISRAGSYFDKINKTQKIYALLFAWFIFSLFEILIIFNIQSELEIYFSFFLKDEKWPFFIILFIGLFNILYFRINDRWSKIINYYNKKFENETKERKFNVGISIGAIFLLAFVINIFWMINVTDRYRNNNKEETKGKINNIFVDDVFDKYKQNEKTFCLFSQHFVFKNGFDWDKSLEISKRIGVRKINNEEIIRDSSKRPNNYIYEIDGYYGKNENIPIKAIFGFWKINSKGKIGKEFFPNPRYEKNKKITLER